MSSGNYIQGRAKQEAARRAVAGKMLKGTVTRARVLAFVIASRNPVRVMEVAAHIGQSDASAHSHLAALVAGGDIARCGVRYTHLESGVAA